MNNRLDHVEGVGCQPAVSEPTQAQQRAFLCSSNLDAHRDRCCLIRRAGDSKYRHAHPSTHAQAHTHTNDDPHMTGVPATNTHLTMPARPPAINFSNTVLSRQSRGPPRQERMYFSTTWRHQTRRGRDKQQVRRPENVGAKGGGQRHTTQRSTHLVAHKLGTVPKDFTANNTHRKQPRQQRVRTGQARAKVRQPERYTTQDAHAHACTRCGNMAHR